MKFIAKLLLLVTVLMIFGCVGEETDNSNIVCSDDQSPRVVITNNYSSALSDVYWAEFASATQSANVSISVGESKTLTGKFDGAGTLYFTVNNKSFIYAEYVYPKCSTKSTVLVNSSLMVCGGDSIPGMTSCIENKMTLADALRR